MKPLVFWNYFTFLISFQPPSQSNSNQLFHSTTFIAFYRSVSGFVYNISVNCKVHCADAFLQLLGKPILISFATADCRINSKWVVAINNSLTLQYCILCQLPMYLSRVVTYVYSLSTQCPVGP